MLILWWTGWGCLGCASYCYCERRVGVDVSTSSRQLIRARSVIYCHNSFHLFDKLYFLTTISQNHRETSTRVGIYV
ncbi:hypothetical protein BDQ17DRAFT_1349747 [Cyathus striatus]|nr:hypothetical protein BDQ17DRAFT_1349747 [Cyathus striatus]